LCRASVAGGGSATSRPGRVTGLPDELRARLAEGERALAGSGDLRASAAHAQLARDGHDDDLREAVSHLQAALEVFASTGLPTCQRGTGQALGDARARLGDHWSEALAAYESALAAADALYVTSLSRPARQAELAEAPALHPNAAYAAARASQLERPRSSPTEAGPAASPTHSRAIRLNSARSGSRARTWPMISLPQRPGYGIWKRLSG